MLILDEFLFQRELCSAVLLWGTDTIGQIGLEEIFLIDFIKLIYF